MKIFKVVLLSVFVVLAVPHNGYCQLGKVASKVSKVFAKKGAKEAGKKGAKAVAKKAAKKTAKELAGETAVLAIRKNATKSLTKKATKKTILKDWKVYKEADMQQVLLKGIGKSTTKGVQKVASRGAKKTSNIIKEVTDRSIVERFGSKESKSLFEKAGKKKLKSSSKKAAAKKTAIRLGKVYKGKDAFELLKDDKALVNRLTEMESKFGGNFSKDNLVVKKAGKHKIIEFPGTNSKVEIKGNTIYAKGGSTPQNGAMNEFLNNPLPNKKYIVDNHIEYVTNAEGKTVSVKCHSSALSNSYQRTSLAKENQTELVKAKGGRQGVHDSGHIQSRSTGGNNEDINLLPMRSSEQRSGSKWFELEKYERDAIADGKDVWSTKTIKYNPDGSYSINVELTIKDLTTGKVIHKNKLFNNLF